MAFSKITINFLSVPSDGQHLNFKETLYNLSLNEAFKNNRLSSFQVKIPEIVMDTYTMTVAGGTNIEDVGAEYTPINGNVTRTPLNGLPVIDNPDGSITFQIISETPVVIYDIATGNNIYWPYGQFDVSSTSGRYNGYISDNYANAFNLDYNISSLFTVVSFPGEINSGLGTVIITAKYSNAVFDNVDYNNDAEITIENEFALPEFSITGITFSAASTNKCQNVKVNVTTNHLATKIISPVSVDPNIANPFSFDVLRSQLVNIIARDINGLQVSQTITTPSYLNANNFNIVANNSPNGATAVINNTGLSGLTLQYSLDNATWQSSNVFPGLEAGDFTAYIKDQFGCSTSLGFNVSEFNISDSYFLYPKSNSIRLAERVVWDYINVFKTDENTLSCESDVELPYKEVQEWQSSDVITNQFRSNYASNVVTAEKLDGTITNILITKKTQNIGIKDKRDAIQYNLGSGKTGIYFNAGNTYDFDTGVINGSYLLNGGRPEWALIGNYIQIGVSWFQIEQILYSEVKASDILVISNVYTGTEATVIVGSIYNRENFEVYEYTVNMASFLNSDFRTKLVASDTHFATKTFLSEQINVQLKRSDLLEIKYKNSRNTDINYSTGIEHLIRVPFNKLSGKYEDENETYKTDTTAILLGSELFEIDEILLEPNTKEIWRKINIALSHDTIEVNSVGYVKSAGFTTEGPLGETNLYVLTASMIKIGNVYNGNSGDSFGYTDEENIEIPNLLESDSGYIEI